ncbi:MAG: Asp-tRNA(Asn)/Glu-tRNA(Gln) amidotransferase subunit GatA [Candidatus Saccharimonadales bacterium]
MKEWEDIATIVKNIKSKKYTAEDLVNKSLQIIEKNQDFNAIIQTIPSRSLERAKVIDDKLQRGEKVGRLAGVPFIAKDNFLTFGSETTAASNILKGFRAPYQSTAINLLENEGAICVAKSNLDAFAHGSSTENSDFMITKNPHDTTKVPGGSSGGSAAAVILSMAPFALGTDTGGSIRLPAAFCGAVGYKPTYGLVSRSGVIAMASSTDVIGPLTTSVKDAAYIMETIANKDSLDSTSIDRQNVDYSSLTSILKSSKIGIVNDFMTEGLQDEIKATILNLTHTLKMNSVHIGEINIPSIASALACYYIIMPAEVSSNLSRYDGQRYGFSDSTATTLDDSYTNTRSRGFGNEAKRRIMIGTYVLSSGYYDAYYRKAQQLRTKLIHEFKIAFDRYDFLISPTAPTTAFNLGQNTKDPLQMYLTDIMTVAANLVGIPAISIPISTKDGLPVGLQIMANQKKDFELLSVAKEIEKVIAK